MKLINVNICILPKTADLSLCDCGEMCGGSDHTHQAGVRGVRQMFL